MKLQHAVSGVLRNIAVATSARRGLVLLGVLDPCLQLLPRLSVIFAGQVVYKLLAILRLVSEGDGDAARKISRDRYKLPII